MVPTLKEIYISLHYYQLNSFNAVNLKIQHKVSYTMNTSMKPIKSYLHITNKVYILKYISVYLPLSIIW